MKKIIFSKKSRIEKAIENWSVREIAKQLGLKLTYNWYPDISDQEVEVWEKLPEPEKTFEHGSCKAAVFANEIKQNGKTATVKNVTIQKRYMDKDGKWKNTNSFGVNDLPKLVLVANKAYDYLTGKKD